MLRDIVDTISALVNVASALHKTKTELDRAKLLVELKLLLIHLAMGYSLPINLGSIFQKGPNPGNGVDLGGFYTKLYWFTIEIIQATIWLHSGASC